MLERYDHVFGNAEIFVMRMRINNVPEQSLEIESYNRRTNVVNYTVAINSVNNSFTLRVLYVPSSSVKNAQNDNSWPSGSSHLGTFTIIVFRFLLPNSRLDC